MAKPRVSAAGGWSAIFHVLKAGRQAGGLLRLYQRMRSRNACKSCALGMGGQQGGMTNENGHFPEVCKKSLQAQAADMVAPITEEGLQEKNFSDLEKLTSTQLEEMGRLAFPIAADSWDNRYHRISWKEAYERIAHHFAQISAEEVFFYSSGRASNESAYLMQLIARSYGCNNIHNCSYYCHSASGVALKKVYGSGTASIVLQDIEKTDLVILVGANPASNHPRLITQLINLRKRGGKVLVVNPLKELGLVKFKQPTSLRSMLFSSKVSDHYVQLNIGTDIAFFKALLKAMIKNYEHNQEFIEKYTQGWEEVKRDLEEQRIDELLDICGVSSEDFDSTVDMLRGTRKAIICWSMGITHHQHGVENIYALANLALAMGWVGKPGSGLLPIRGHSNIQGVGSMGANSSLTETVERNLRKYYGLSNLKTGMDTHQSMCAAIQGKISAALMLGGNLFSSNPNRSWAGKALRNIPMTVYLSTKLNEGHVHGRGQSSIVLPVLTRDEETFATTQESMFNYIRLSSGGVPHFLGEARSEVNCLIDLAEKILPKSQINWNELRSHQNIRRDISRTIPGFEKLAQIDDNGKEFQISGRTFHDYTFRTESGKAKFNPCNTPIKKTDQFMLMTVRSDNQFNTVVYEETDFYRGNRTRDVVMISKDDAKRLGIKEGFKLEVQTEVGSMKVKASIVDIQPGNIAMYYPEANALVPNNIDQLSGTPSFKSVSAKIKIDQ